MLKSGKRLTRSDLRPGTEIRSKKDPSLGVWEVMRPGKGGWRMRRRDRTGEQDMSENDLLRFWEKVAIDRKQIIHEAMLAFLKETRREPEDIVAGRQDALVNLKDADHALQKEQPARMIQAILAAIDTSVLRPNEKSALGNLRGLVRRAQRMGDVGLDARAQMKEEVPDLIKLIMKQQPPHPPKATVRPPRPSKMMPVRRPALATAHLRKQLIRLAHENPGKIRDSLLPLLTAAKKDLGKPEVIHGMKFGGTRYKYNYGINIDHVEKDGDFLVWQVGKTTKKHGKAKSLKEAEKLALRKCEFTTKPSH